MVRLFVYVVLIGALVGCQRKTSVKEVGFKIPLFEKSFALADSRLSYVAINIKYPDGSQALKTFEIRELYDDTTAISKYPEVVKFDPASGYLELVLAGAYVKPTTNALFQFLGIYGSETSSQETFKYFESKNQVISDDLTEIVVVPQQVVTTNALTEFGGRLLDTPTQGPTGKVGIYFQPQSGSPAMKVHETHIINGWFEFVAFQGMKLTYKLEATGRVLIKDITHGDARITNPTGNHVVSFSAPAYTRNRWGSDSDEPELASTLTFGFFKSPGSTVDLSAFTACYLNRSYGVVGAKVQSTGHPLVYNPTGTSSSSVARISGGQGYGFGDLTLGTNCMMKGPNHMTIYPWLLGEGKDTAFGMRGPFAVVDPTSTSGTFIQHTFNSTTNQLVLKWQMLSGTPAVFPELAFYAKPNTNGGDSHLDREDEIPCNEFANQQGMTLITKLNSGQNGGTINVTPQQLYNNNLFVCPLRASGIGAFEAIEAYDLYGYGHAGMTSKGLGAEAKTISGSTTYETVAAGGLYAKVQTIAASSFAGFVDVGLDGLHIANNLAEGDEVYIYVGAQSDPNNGGNECGYRTFYDTSSNTAQTDPITIGAGDFYRVYSSASGVLTLRKKGLLNDFSNTANHSLLSVTPDPNTMNSFCGVYMAKVLEFTNLTIGPEVTLTADSFSYTQGGGAILVRASGEVLLQGGSASTAFNAKGSGYPISAIAGSFGGGPFGPGTGVSDFTGGGEGGSLDTAGGAGAGGSGGDAGSSALSGGSMNFNREMFVMGTASGSSSMYTGSDAAGGGWGMLATPKLVVEGTNQISAAGGDSTYYKVGAGGGGSVRMFVDKIVEGSGSGNLYVSAQGGSVDNTTSPIGGVGGGGYLEISTCEDPGTLLTYNFSVGQFGFMTGAGSMGGNPVYIDNYNCY